MAGCITYALGGISRDTGCKAGVGGIMTLYLIDADKVDITLPTVEEGTPATGELKVTTIKNKTGSKWYEYSFNPNTGSMTSTFETDETRSYNVFTTEVALQFMGQDSSKRMQIMAMCMNQTVAVVRDANGKYWLLGGNGKVVQASAATAVTGVGAKEFNGYTVTLSVEDTQLPYEIPDTEWAKQDINTRVA